MEINRKCRVAGKETSMCTLRQMEVHRSTQRLSVSMLYITIRLTVVLEKLPQYAGALPIIKSNKVENGLV